MSTAAAPAAFGERAHAFASSFAGPGTVAGEAGSLSLAAEPTGEAPGSGLAVNDSTHDVYVADTGNRRVDEFTSAGVFVRAWGWGVVTGAEELQVCTTTCQVGHSGAKPGEFETASYITVDNDPESASHGDVYVGDTANKIVTKFTAAGELVSSWGTGGQLKGSPTEAFNSGFAGLAILGVASDGLGNLLVYNGHERLFKFTQDGTWTETFNAATQGGPGGGGIAVDQACKSSCALITHEGGGRIQQFAPDGTNTGVVTTGGQAAQGIGIDAGDEDVYAVRSRSLIEDIPGWCVRIPSPTGCVPSQIFGETQLGNGTGLAVDSSSGAVYAADATAESISRFAVVLEASIEPASAIHAHDAVLHGLVNPVGTELSACRFEYGSTPNEYSASVPCAESVGSIGVGSSPVPVEATVSNLTGGTKYYVRLRAANATVGMTSEPDELTTAVTPVVVEVKTSGLTATGATLEAVVNPEGIAAKYHFEYGECPHGACSPEVPFAVTTPESEIPAGSSNVTASQPVASLTAGQTYHFRIDVNGEAAFSPEGVFVLEPPAPVCSSERPAVDHNLADCRAYEMVTPPGKNGALINNGAFLQPPAVSLNGSRVLMQSIQCFDAPSSCTAVRQQEGTTYSFERAPAGWLTDPLAPPIASGSSVLTYNAETRDVWYTSSSTQPGFEDMWVREPAGSVRDLGRIAEGPGQQIENIGTALFVSTSDASRVVFEGTGLWPSLEVEPGLEVWTYPSTASGRPQPVAVTGGAGSTSLISACGARLGGNTEPHSLYNSLSADGAAIFFSAARCPSGTGSNTGIKVPAVTLYERVDGDSTVLVSGSGSPSECNTACQNSPPGDASFEGASVDGSDAFFTDTRRLTNEASEDSHEGDSAHFDCAATVPSSSGCNLYEFVCPAHCDNEAERKLIDISAGDASGLGPQVQGVVAIPPNGSDVYFVAHGVLSGASPTGGEPVAGLDNLYVYKASENGAPGHPTFIATLPSSDNDIWHKQGGIGIANVTPDGRFLVFTSHRALTSDTSRHEGPAQVYRYDAQTEELVRISIGASGFNDNGNAGTADARIASAFQSFAGGAGPASSNPSVSENGELVFFQSPTGLTPDALNDTAVIGDPKVLAENVYAWEADGAQPSASAPACGNPAGCVSLISDGKDRSEGTDQHGNASAVELLGTDESGRNVFFWTADPILRRDTDSQVDLYDARVDGGLPEPEPEPGCATLSACHPFTPDEGILGVFSSGLPSGLGNFNGAPAGPGNATTTRELAPAQRLAREIEKCRVKHGRARGSCELVARARYRERKLVLALTACRRDHGQARKHCEQAARASYGNKTSRRSKGK
ncbi:MAG TPA: hypothetical protein VGH60_00155 [Solirubrobacteraceae bacterium]